MDALVDQAPWLAAVGVVAGLWLLWHGLAGYRTASRLGDVSTSRIASIAAGEVRVSGTIEAAELTLVSPLQSRPCVYYRSWIRSDADTEELVEERAVGFRVRDGSGAIRVFPRGARWDAPSRLDTSTDVFGDAPPELDLRTGSAFGPGALDGDGADPDGLDRARAIDALLTVNRPDGEGPSTLSRLAEAARPAGRGRARYREQRLAPGDPVTVVGRAIPFGDLEDPTAADIGSGSGLLPDDPEVAADIAEARAAGRLAASPDAAWGNAAIAGFGIGRPVRTPILDARATVPGLAPASEAARSRRFDIEPTTLVLIGGSDIPLLIAHGLPAAAVERHHDRFLVGLFGALLAIGSAMALAISMTGGAVR